MSYKHTKPIDFVLTWVDGNDSEWQKEKAKYSPNKNTDSRNIRYRDWDNLKYWFRGVEKYAPWVNKIYFVTCGHYPEWLNKNNPKLVCVKHSDYIPSEYLPTFSSHPIELNFHRIKDLSEQFVYFNDDLFVVNKIKPSDYFRNDKPCGEAIFKPPGGEDEIFLSVLFNNSLLINRNFKKKDIVKKNIIKYLNLRYGTDNLKTMLCLPWDRIQGFAEFHCPNAFLKSTFNKVWENEYKVLNETSKHKFRSNSDVNQYIFKNWQFCEGNFTPFKQNSKFIRIDSDYKKACNLIEQRKYKVICLNDSNNIDNFEEVKNKIKESFEKIFPEKSSFEK